MERFQMPELRDKCRNRLNVTEGEIVWRYDNIETC
jgi:hypothetical protein